MAAVPARRVSFLDRKQMILEACERQENMMTEEIQRTFASLWAEFLREQMGGILGFKLKLGKITRGIRKTFFFDSFIEQIHEKFPNCTLRVEYEDLNISSDDEFIMAIEQHVYKQNPDAHMCFNLYVSKTKKRARQGKLFLLLLDVSRVDGVSSLVVPAEDDPEGGVENLDGDSGMSWGRWAEDEEERFMQGNRNEIIDSI